MSYTDQEDDESFISSVCHFWTEKGDPERYSGWDAERCKRLLPAFYEAWSKAKVYEELTDLAAKDAMSKLPY